MKVSIIMGSLSDRNITDEVIEMLNEFQVPWEAKVFSAHRAHSSLMHYIDEKDHEIDVYIAIAGKAAHLAGVVASLTVKPVIGVPVHSSALAGLDALLSTVQMPKGVPVATVAINGGRNAAILAVQILAGKHGALNQKLMEQKRQMEEEVVSSAYSYKEHLS